MASERLFPCDLARFDALGVLWACLRQFMASKLVLKDSLWLFRALEPLPLLIVFWISVLVLSGKITG
jgi:hypothetical protein